MAQKYAAEVFSANEMSTQELGESLGRIAQPGDVVALSGDLGAGKTQLTKGIARGLGIADPVTSPTFNILLVHEGRIPLYHFDLYRLDEPDQLDDIDYFGTIEGDGVSVVEWGDRFAEAVPDDAVVVNLRIVNDEHRRIDIVGSGVRGAALAAAWVAAATDARGAGR